MMSGVEFAIISPENLSSAELNWEKCFVCQKSDESEKENLINPGKPRLGKILL